MPTGEHTRRRPPPAAGTTYLLLLFLLALVGASLAALGTAWQAAAQRQRETELLFRGEQIRDALQRFQDSTPSGAADLPRTLADLLADRRGPEPRHHLRRLYTDPFTGRPDWLLLRDAAGGIFGVHSRSNQPALRRLDLPEAPPLPAGVAGTPHDPPQVGDWLFAIPPRLAASRSPA